ncbi:Uncharacterised protein [Salmonella enterica]|nr:Uncharacterised protein [Salmonella enterica]
MVTAYSGQSASYAALAGRDTHASTSCDAIPTLTSATLTLLALRQAFAQLFASPQQGENLFWQTLYRQHWLKGTAITADTFLPHVLSELNQQWQAHPHQHNMKDDTSVAVLVDRLLPHIRSPSQQKTLVRIARRSEQKPQDNTTWAVHLNHQQTEIKQLIEAIDMTDKDVKNSVGTPWDKPQENAEPVTVHNAGLVIASVYIPALFQRLGMTDGRKFVDSQSQLQALFVCNG